MKLGQGIIRIQDFEALLLSCYRVVREDLYLMIIYWLSLKKTYDIERAGAFSTSERGYFHALMVQ